MRLQICDGDDPRPRPPCFDLQCQLRREGGKKARFRKGVLSTRGSNVKLAEKEPHAHSHEN